MTSILRWAGSKRKLLKELRHLTPKGFGLYLEPFAGSAVLFFELAPAKGVLGDINPEVIATYTAIRDEPDSVYSFLETIPKTNEGYYKLRAIDPSTLNGAQRAARLIFLMKACFNGVYRTNRQGLFNVPLGNRFFALPDREAIDNASRALKNINLVCGDFSNSISNASAGDFIYIDPPYSDSKRFRGEYSYKGAFKYDDLERLLDICKHLSKKDVKILLSFKESEDIVDALKGWSFKHIEVARSVSGFAHSRRNAREILAYNY